MGQRAAALADQYEQVLAELAKTVEGVPDTTWRAICGDERWTVAATAHHVGAQLPLEREYITAAAEGREMPAYTWDDINGRNARHAQDFASCTKEQALSVIRENGSSIAAYVRGLSDEQLERTATLALADGATVSTQQLIEGGVLIDHARTHLGSIRSAG